MQKLKRTTLQVADDIDITRNSNSLGRSSHEDVSIWKNCLSREFPVISSKTVGGETVYKIGEPHSGYYMTSRLELGSLDKKSQIYDADGNLRADLQTRNQIGNGKCTLYYKTGERYFDGNLSQGYRNGLGIEYNKNGTIIFKGFFQNGCRNFHITNRMDRSNYWNERDDTGNLVSVCRKDESGKNDGICYFYLNGDIKYISRWEHGVEVEILHTFEGGIMKSYKFKKLIYEGKYLKKSDFEYIQQENVTIIKPDNQELPRKNTRDDGSKWKIWKWDHADWMVCLSFFFVFSAIVTVIVIITGPYFLIVYLFYFMLIFWVLVAIISIFIMIIRKIIELLKKYSILFIITTRLQ